MHTNHTTGKEKLQKHNRAPLRRNLSTCTTMLICLWHAIIKHNYLPAAGVSVRFVFTWDKHAVVGSLRFSLKVNKSLYGLSHTVCLSGSVSSLEFGFPEWLHIPETCGGVLMTTSRQVFHVDLLFGNRHLEQNQLTCSPWAHISSPKTVISKKDGSRCEEHGDIHCYSFTTTLI